MRRAIESVTKLEDVLFGCETHPWRGCNASFWSMTLEDDVRHHFIQLAEVMESRVRASTALTALGFLPANPRLSDIDSAVEAAREAEGLPRVPPSWFASDPRRVTAGYLTLHDCASKSEAIRQELAPYRADAFRRHDGAMLRRLNTSNESLDRLMPHPCTQLRATREHLTTVADELAQVQSVVRRIEDDVCRSLTLLRRPPQTITIDSLSRVAAALGLLSGLGLTHPSWFDAEQRESLRSKLGDFAREAQELSAIRSTLDQRFTAAAFAAGAEELLSDVLAYRSWVRRLFRGWRRCRKQFSTYYDSPAPRPANAVLKDASMLRGYRLRRAKFTVSIGPYRTMLGWSEDRSFDWENTQADLNRVAQVQTVFPIPPSLVELLGIEGAFDRTCAAEAAAQLKDTLQALRQSLARLNEVYSVDPITSAQSTPEQLGQWLESAERVLRHRCGLMDSVLSLLNDDADVRLDDLPTHFDQLDLLNTLYHRAEEAARELNIAEPLPHELRASDWRHQADLAGEVNAVLARSPDLPNRLVKAMTDEAARAALRSAVASTEASDTPAYVESLQFAKRLFDFKSRVSVGIVVDEVPAIDVASWLRARVVDIPSLQRWLQFREARQLAESLGLGILVSEMVSGKVPVRDAEGAFLKQLYREWLDAAAAADPAVRGFSLDAHESSIERFRNLDVQAIDRCYERVRSSLLSDAGWRSNEFDAPASSEKGILLREVNKRRRHLPLRRLFKEISTLLPKLKPCLMMSPLAVSTFFDSDLLKFDLVIFDEASQVRPHDAICAIYRGKQLLVAGDQKQLPPTAFFERMGGNMDSEEEAEEDDEADSTRDFESILDVCATLHIPRRRLRWHYRSRRESLIAFSNHHFYDDDLVTFPSSLDSQGDRGVRLEYVPAGRWHGGTGAGVNPIEAEYTAAIVLEYARQNPQSSLGVITMNQAQQLLVLEHLERKRRSTPRMDDFFSESNLEPFFVKNLENVQGDERDAIILTVNYANNDLGDLSHNFGPLNKPGGERRLNVAVTRARDQLIVISSIRCDEIDLKRTQSRGARLLRSYLDFAERGPEAMAAEIREQGNRDFESDFEREVARALEAEGLDVRRQVGCGTYRIDLAIVDPDRPGRYVLGIECDGATYHSSVTARDRDRLRQEVLEDLGWTICRVWSTDWVRDPRRQIERVLRAFQAAKVAGPKEFPPRRRRGRRTPKNSAEGQAGNGNGRSIPAPQTVRPQPRFGDIAQVPEAIIDTVIQQLLRENGAIPEADLARAAAKRLGFDRTGNRIAGRLAQRFRALQRLGKIAVDESGKTHLR